jgi:hypothetical protein
MKESHDEGVATHIGPESCAVAREGGGEALTGERAGQPLSREKGFHFRVPTLSKEWEGNTANRAFASGLTDPARSKTLRMHGSTSHGNREIPPSSGEQHVQTASGSPRTQADDAR